MYDVLTFNSCSLFFTREIKNVLFADGRQIRCHSSCLEKVHQPRCIDVYSTKESAERPVFQTPEHLCSALTRNMGQGKAKV